MADTSFDYAVIIAGMRTGSNLLEESLASFPGVVPLGELFNPHFFGRPKTLRAFGFDMDARDADPLRVIEAAKADADGFPVFRLFQDHDDRVLSHVLADPRAAKIVLTRDPLASWVSLQIARRTGQWWLSGSGEVKTAKIRFDRDDFVSFCDARQVFYDGVARSLRHSGQAAFSLSYGDLFDGQVISGVGRFLGLDGAPDLSQIKARVQNPAPISDRLQNAAEAEEALTKIFAPDLSRTNDYEPPRGPGLRGFTACVTVPLLYMPLRGAAEDPVPIWLEQLDPAGETLRDMNQKDLRRWWRGHVGHRSFTIIRHPLPRAFDAFARHIMPADGFSDIREVLVKRHDLRVPEGADWTNAQVAEGFIVFLEFLERNLRGQTSVRIDTSWASQNRLLSAISTFASPDIVIREDEMESALRTLAARFDVDAPKPGDFSSDAPVRLKEIVTDEMNRLCARAYRRDMLHFGFSDWTG